MNRFMLIAALGGVSLGLSACGSESPEPVEQIVVREPGQAAAAPAAAGAVAVDLVAAGQSAFGTCAACHAAEAGGPSGIGPNLHGVVGRVAGGAAGYRYSDAMSGSGLTWDEATLDEFLANPSAKVPGTRMMAGAVSDPQARAAIIAYLATLS